VAPLGHVVALGAVGRDDDVSADMWGGAVRRHSSFNLIRFESGMKIDLFALSDDPLDCLTCHTVRVMPDVSIRELRNHGGDVVARAERGEQLTITRGGRPVAELIAVRRPAVPIDELRRRWAHLPPVDPVALRDDIDDVIDPALRR